MADANERRTTVAELISVLRTMPQDATWNGWDDESLVIHNGNRDQRGRAALTDYAIIHPRGTVERATTGKRQDRSRYGLAAGKGARGALDSAER